MKKTNSITLTGSEYETLLKAIVLAGSIYGITGDFCNNTYKKNSKDLEKLEHSILKQASNFGFGELCDTDDKDLVIKMESGWYDKTMEVMSDYDDYVAEEMLSNKLAWRDFHADYSEAEIKFMLAKKKSDYFGVELYDYEKKYWDEFEKYGFERLRIVV